MLLFFDVDGTLLDDRHSLVPSVGPAFEAARRNGHLLIINTGRTLCNQDKRLKDLPLDGWVMGCGTRVMLRGRTVQAMEYEPEQSLRLREVFLSLDIPVVYECDTGMYFDESSPAHPAISFMRKFSEREGIARQVRKDDPEFRAVKMFTFSDREDVIREVEAQTAALGMPYTAIDRGQGGWEIIPAGYSKAAGIDVVCRETGCGLEDCFAFGDSSNDLTMLRHVAHSVAMGNAEEKVKAICSYVTARPEEDGIQKAMEHFNLI